MKTKVNPNDFQLWGVGKGNSAYGLMVEALRRFTRFQEENGTDLARVWVGLGTASAYRPAYNAGLMIPLHGEMPAPRTQTWWLLTEKGQSIIREWLRQGYDYHKIEAGQFPPAKSD